MSRSHTRTRRREDRRTRQRRVAALQRLHRTGRIDDAMFARLLAEASKKS